MCSVLNNFRLNLSILVVLVLSIQNAMACPDIDGLVDRNCDGVLRIVTFGDSITKGEQDELGLGYPGRLVEFFFPQAKIHNLGHSGETTSAGRIRASRLMKKYPNADYTIVLEGVNDFFKDKSSALSRSNLLNIIKTAKNLGSKTLLSKLTQVNRSRFKSQEVWVERLNLEIRRDTSIDFFSLGKGILSRDKLHPNGRGYQQMASVASVALQNVGAANRPRDNDGDGIYDFAEHSKYHTNSNLNDSDGDGLSDGAEVFTYNTNPNSVDSDNDGTPDGEEVNQSSDPNNPLPRAPTINSIEALY